VNAYEVKAGTVYLQSKSCVIHIPERFRGEVLMMGRYTYLRTFSYCTLYSVLGGTANSTVE